ncbi:MAG TPA: hypothetical protein DCX06_05970 [Opitutae bacterium]|nr:hypothetical protein [Opitutae bacterium]
MEQLERTRTNAATDSKGQAFGLSGNLFLYPIVGVVAALSVATICFSVLKLGLLISAIAALPFFVFPTLYVIFLRHNRPKGFDRDWFDNVSSQGFSFVKANQPMNPRLQKGDHV